MTLPRLCIVNIDGYPLYNPDCRAVFGGAEVRLWLIAKELAKTGRCEISVIVADHGQREAEYIDGLKVQLHPAYRSSIRVDSSIKTSWRWWQRRAMFAVRVRRSPTLGHIGTRSISQARVAVYDQVQADVYLCISSVSRAAELALYCEWYDKKFIFLAGSDVDFDPRSTYRDSVIQQCIIDRAKLLIAQTEYQRSLLLDSFHREALVIGNPVDTNRYFPEAAKSDTILWVGKQNEIKRPEIFMNLTRKLVDYDFILIANPMPESTYKNDQWLPMPPNVTFLEYVPFRLVEKYFSTAKVFVNTSTHEGFPNTFLQAAKYGVPIVSLQVDPGEMLSKHRCGLLCQGSFERLQKNVRALMETPELYAELSDNCKKYVYTHHRLESVSEAYERAILSVLKPK